jgi:hypothetical protein
MLVGGFLHASMSNLQSPHVDALPPFTMSGGYPGTSTHDPEPLRGGSGRLFFTGPSYRIPVSRRSWVPAGPRLSRFCLCNGLQVVLDRKSCSMRGPTPVLRTSLNLDFIRIVHLRVPSSLLVRMICRPPLPCRYR